MMARATELVKRIASYINTHKIKSILGGIGVLAVIFYGLAFFIPKNVQFSYGGDTCVGQLTLFPGIHKATDETKFKVSLQNEVKIGSFALAATKTCFAATVEPKSGKVTIATSPLGGVIARKHFFIQVPDAPTANVVNLGSHPLPVTKPLEIALSGPDSVFSYFLENETNIANCTANNHGVLCNMPALKLQQGKRYSLKLTRSFRGNAKTTLVEKPIRTLDAVEIKKSSLKNGQTVYSKPSTFTFTVDKPLATSEATLSSKTKKPQQIPVKTSVKDKTLTILLPYQLKRETKYHLTLKNVEATDGSTLTEPEKIYFSMSGGPKVSGVNIGGSRVDPSASVTLTFDQKMRAVDIGKYVSIVGGKATISQQSKTVTVQLQNLPRCKAFTITIKPGLQSKYKITTKKAWEFTSRTTCYSVETIGYSHKGRAIQAYTFGSGLKNILFTGAIHGNEKSSYLTMQSWIQYLESRAPSLPKGKQVVVVPMVNPDGYYVYGRKNARDVNLNRNFPTTNWKEDIKISSSQTDKGGGGRAAGSEFETKALISLTNRINPYLVITYHSSGSLVNSNIVSPAASRGSAYANAVGYGFVSDADTAEAFGFTMTGTYEDWLAETGRAAFLVELPSDYGSYGNAHANAMWSMI